MAAIHEKLKETGDEQLLSIGGVQKSYKEGAQMYDE